MSWFDVLLGASAALCGAGLLLSLASPSRQSPAVIAWVGGLASIFLGALGAGLLFAGAPIERSLWSIPAIGSVLLRGDPVAGLFLLVTAVTFLPGCIFARASLPRLLPRYSGRAYGALYFTLLASIQWILLSGDAFSFLVAWEIMSISCYLLVTFEHERESSGRAGYLMLTMGEAGALVAALGLLLLAAHAGSLSFHVMRVSGATLGTTARLAVFLLTFFGFGVKAGLVPVNAWLPRAYTAAPAAFVPLLAGATLNLGLYGIFRVNADLLPVASLTPGTVALIIGILSALIGILYATTERDLKAILAHSSIENAGIIIASFGAGFVFAASDRPVLAAVAFLVGLYHLVNHSLYKTLLYIGAGVVEERTGTRDLDRLGGLARRMPLAAIGVLVGCAAIAALPPLNGFVSEWLTLQVFLRSAELAPIGVKMTFALCGAGLALTAALAITCFVRLFAMGFLGMARSPKAERAREPATSAVASMAFLAVLCLALGVLPTYAIDSLNRVVQPIARAPAAPALVPPFFLGSAGHDRLPPEFAQEFHDLGAQVGQGWVPGPGLVILHRGGDANPVVFAASPSYLAVVIGAALLLVFLGVRLVGSARRTVVRQPPWDGGIRRLLPEMTYTGTGFSNPVRVIFQAVLQPTVVEDTRETVAEHFRTAIRREDAQRHIVDRFVIDPARRTAWRTARTLAGMHHGRINAYLAYVLLAFVGAMVIGSLLR